MVYINVTPLSVILLLVKPKGQTPASRHGQHRTLTAMALWWTKTYPLCSLSKQTYERTG